MVITPNKWELDVQGYLNLCNITAATPRKQIRDFAYGVNELGLWNSMVCWPLRSSQNAGTGTTAYSLGGLGTFNGTLVNGPSWDPNGVDFTNDSNQHILTTFTPISTDDFYMFACYEGNAQGTENNVLASTRTTGAAKGFTFSSNWSSAHRAVAFTDAGSIAVVGPGSITDGSYNTATMRGSVSGGTLTVGIAVNTSAETTGSIVGTVDQNASMLLGNETTSIPPRSLGGILSFAGYFKSASLNTLALRDLYKFTLGTGLGLP